jgi:hypothetical protein
MNAVKETKNKLIAKPIIADKFWVVTDGVNKVGNIEADGTHYNLKLGDSVLKFDSTQKITKTVSLEFEKKIKFKVVETTPYAVWPVDSKRTYNNMIDVVNRLHVFTKTSDSKCYYAAGWFAVNYGDGVWQTELCPKYIFVKRYAYIGPFKTQREAQNEINKLDDTN